MNTPRERPADSTEALYLPTDLSPEEIFQAIGRLRKEARDEVDRLIRFLDKTDDYVSRELEDSADDNPQEEAGDEPSLGFLDLTNQERICEGLSGDREDEHDGAEPDVDGEPSLGAFEGHHDQDASWGGETSVVDGELDGAETNAGEGLMSELKLITPRRNFLIKALGFTAAGATVTIPMLVADDPQKRVDYHLRELTKALQEQYPEVRLSGGVVGKIGVAALPQVTLSR